MKAATWTNRSQLQACLISLERPDHLPEDLLPELSTPELEELWIGSIVDLPGRAMSGPEPFLAIQNGNIEVFQIH